MPTVGDQQDSTTPPVDLGKRARIACKNCHTRRVKCDASVSQPCWHCRLRGTTCELIESRRGKYARNQPTRKRKDAKRRAPAHSTSTQPSTVTSGISSPAEPIHHANLHSLLSPPNSTVQRQVETQTDEENTVRGTHGREDGPEMLYARMAEPEPSPDESNPITVNSRSFYMGESFSLSFVVRTICTPISGPAVRLHYPIPSSISNSGSLEDSDPAKRMYLQMYGALTLPHRDVSDELVRVFFESVHPAYPVFDRQDFCTQYQQGTASLLVLQTIFYLAFTVCSTSLIRKAGFADRQNARKSCYLRAKALYDMDYEQNKVTLTSVLFLFGFWWEGPEDQKDTWHWMGNAISLAQTLGMHRTTVNSGMSARQRALWKRIWWSIYIRDRHSAAALGRPVRIHNEDCDIEMLTTEDLLADLPCDNQLVGDHQPYQISYLIEMAKLSIVLGKILTGEFSPRPGTMNYDRGILAEELKQWERELPEEMRRVPLDYSLGAAFWASMLHSLYHLSEILLFRPERIDSHSPDDIEREKKARAAADAITRIAEDLLSAGTLIYSQLHLVPSLFAALSIHTIVVRRRDPIRGQLAENKARQCMLAMSELAKSWPVAGWILRLFVNLMKRLTRNTAGDGDGRRNSGAIQNRNSATSTAVARMHSSDPSAGSGFLPTPNMQDMFGCDQLMCDTLWDTGQGVFDTDLTSFPEAATIFPWVWGIQNDIIQ